MTIELGRIWREGDSIEFVVPFPTILHTFMAVFSMHDPLICQLVDQFSYHINPTTVGSTPDGRAILQLKQVLATSHEGIVPEEDRTIHQGTPEMFDGMFYGNMHPWELAVLAMEISQSIEAVSRTASAHNLKRAVDAVTPWLRAADELLTPKEIMGVLLRNKGDESRGN